MATIKLNRFYTLALAVALSACSGSMQALKVKTVKNDMKGKTTSPSSNLLDNSEVPSNSNEEQNDLVDSNIENSAIEDTSSSMNGSVADATDLPEVPVPNIGITGDSVEISAEQPLLTDQEEDNNKFPALADQSVESIPTALAPQTSVSAAVPNSIINTVYESPIALTKSLDQPVVTQLEPVVNSEGVFYSYDMDAKECISQIEEVGVNQNQLAPCGKLSAVSNVNLSGADLAGINIVNGEVKNVVLVDAKLIGADFSGAKIDSVDFTGADITEANFDGALLSNSIVRDYEVIQQMLDNGAEIGLNNTLPVILDAIDEVAQTSDEIILKAKTNLDDEDINASSNRDIASLSGRSEIRKEALNSQDDVKELKKKIDELRQTLTSERKELSRLKDQRDKQNETLKQMSSNVGSSKKDLNDLLAKEKALSKDFKEQKEKYSDSKDKSEKKKIEEKLFEIKKSKKEIANKIKEFKKKQISQVPKAKKIIEDVEELVESADKQKEKMVKLQEKSKDLRDQIKEQVSQLKALRIKYKKS